jgi:glucose-6-phosphate 1-epimerase
MPNEIEALNESFAIGEIAQVIAGSGGLPKVEIASPAAAGEIYLHGAQVTSWRPEGHDEVLFLSQHSRWEEGRAIRGGIPVCFPWFRGKADDPKAPAHGFARTRSWKLKSVMQQADNVVVTMVTESDEASLRWWPHQVLLQLSVTMGSELELALTATNTGTEPFSFEEALHTYHRVGDVANVHVSGLDGVTFLNNMDGNRAKVQSGDVVMAGPTDNAYLNTDRQLILIDSDLRRRIQIEKRSSLTTVVWNPWASGALALTDLGDEEWRQMACVEASNILSNAVTLAPKESHTMGAIISVIHDDRPPRT